MLDKGYAPVFVSIGAPKAKYLPISGREGGSEKGVIGGDAAFGPENIITAFAYGHQAAISGNLLLNGSAVTDAPPTRGTNFVSTKMGIHQWA